MPAYFLIPWLNRPSTIASESEISWNCAVAPASTAAAIEPCAAIAFALSSLRFIVPPRRLEHFFNRGAKVRIVPAIDEVDALIHLLRLPTRRHPVVVITIAAGRTEPYVDSDTVVEVAPGQVHVLVLPTGPLSWRLSGALGDLAGVYGGAARVYGIDNAWVSNPYASALHFSYDRGGGARAADKLASEVLADLHRHGATSEQVRPTLQVDGAVEGLIAQTRALVRLTDGQLATVWAEITAEGCHIDQLVTPGMVMSGDLDPEWHRLDVSGMRMSAADALGHYEVGDVVLVRVDEVTHRSAVVCLLPGTTVLVPMEDISDNPLDAATDLLTVGETVPARLVERLGDGQWRVAFLDVDDDDEPVDAPAVLRGGPPWLTKPPARVPGPEVANLTAVTVFETSAEPDPEPAEVSAVAGVAQEELSERLAALDIERAGLVKELRREKAKSLDLAAQLESSKRQVRNLRGTQKKARAAAVADGSWPTAEEALKWELTCAWVMRVSAQDKATQPLPDYAVGPNFVASLDSAQSIKREKVLQIVVEVLLGSPPRDTHALRSNLAGGSPPVVREDGAMCMRAPLQVGTPSARRLHWWRLIDGSIELSRVVVHDDYNP